MGEVTYAKQTPEQAKILQLTKDVEDFRSAHSSAIKENQSLTESNKRLIEAKEDLQLELTAAKQYTDQLVKERSELCKELAREEEKVSKLQKDYDDLYAAFRGLSHAFKIF